MDVVEIPILHRNGSVHTVLWNSATVYGADGKTAVATIAQGQDITRRKIAEEELKRVNRELRAISDCNQTLVRATDEYELLTDVCRIICDTGGYRMAWVGIVEHDEAKTVKPVAWGGHVAGYLDNASITWADTERGRGPTGLAVRSGKTHFFQDFASEPAAAPWREAAQARGYRSSIAVPLRDADGRTFAVFTIYAALPNFFNPTEIKLLEELAGDLSFGIGVLRGRAKRKQAEEALRKSEEKLRLHAENSPLAIVEWDADFVVTRWAGAAEAMFGWTASETVGKPIAELNLIYEPDIPIVEATMVRLTDGSRAVTSSNRNITKSGKVIWCTWYNSVLYDENGKMISVMSEVEDVTEHRRVDQAKDEFISLVSHELRNPLTVIIGSVQTALSPGLSAEEIRFLLQNASEGGRSWSKLSPICWNCPALRSTG